MLFYLNIHLDVIFYYLPFSREKQTVEDKEEITLLRQALLKYSHKISHCDLKSQLDGAKDLYETEGESKSSLVRLIQEKILVPKNYDCYNTDAINPTASTPWLVSSVVLESRYARIKIS